jgi:hypothetical protein
MYTEPPYKTKILKTDFLGRPFNSVNDVVVHSDGSVWFTDPIYGFEKGYRPTPRLPSQVYRWCPDTGAIRSWPRDLEDRMASASHLMKSLYISPSQTEFTVTVLSMISESRRCKNNNYPKPISVFSVSS